MASSPYKKPGRLSDVVAAITALGTYKFYKLDAQGWADRISGGQKAGEHWVAVFQDHPEFFRRALDVDKYSLVWRRQLPRNFDVDAEKEVLGDHNVAGRPYDRISRRPLAPTELTALIGIAVNLHQAAMTLDQSRRWWLPLVAAVLGFLGAVVGGALK